MSHTKLTEKQEDVLDLLPDTRENIAEELDVSRRAVRYRMQAAEDEGYEFERDSGGVWRVSDEGDGGLEEEGRDDEEPWRTDAYERSQATKEIHNELTEIEKEVKDALSETKPVRNHFDRDEDAATLVLPHSDSHIGAVIQSRHGVDYYSAEEASRAISSYFDAGIEYANQRDDVEDVTVILNGDHVDGEGVYPAQRHEQEDNLREQIFKGAKTYTEQIRKLASQFDNVEVYCVPGNHGDISKRSTTNADMILFDFIEMVIDASDEDNVHIEKSGPGGFHNFDIRGWDYFARHGQDYLNHIGTSSGIRRALDWHSQYDFDVGLRSHYHSIKYECIADEVPIVMTGSTAPPSTFAESKGSEGGNCGVFWFTTEDRPIEGFQPIRI